MIFLFSSLNLWSINKVDSLLRVYEERHMYLSDSEKSHVCHDISYLHMDPDEKLKYAKLAHYHANKCNDFTEMAASKYLEAAVYIKLGILDKGIECLYESKKLYKKNGILSGEASVDSKLGLVYCMQKNYLKSEESYKRSIALFDQVKDSLRLVMSVLNLGVLYREMDKTDLALDNYRKAEDLFLSINNYHYYAYAKGNIGSVYIDQNKLDSAEIYINKSIEIFESLGDNEALSLYYNKLAIIYLKRKQYENAKQSAIKSLQLAQKFGLKERIQITSLNLSEIYNQVEDYKKAFYYHKQYVAYRDSINNEETIREIANLHTKYEIAQKQKEVDEEKASKNRYLVIAISSAIVLVVLTVLVFIILKISRDRRKTNIILEQQRKELENANATKNKFFSILSHDLRSPLATFHSYAEVIEICSQHQDIDKLLVLGKELKSSSANLLDLLDNLLQWGVNQMGDHKSTPNTVNLKDVALMEVEHLKHVSHKKNIAVIVNIQPSVTLFVDRVQLSIALRNLLNNAIKFTPAEGSVTISAEDSKLFITLKVTDTGVGMTQEQKETLFDFNKINSTYGTQNEKGVGLGMQLVCGFVRENNAKLHVETELGKGTTFAIVFEKK
ncbi:tetratricopeptide repeat-containing sensor histidine kinase [Plebeiibacterium sediminum]|uniref:histidine kinase n=1 Tax=Plebeiibacterium sediminum TaxID=2992112 RepID=A0AAE3M338_9BACT|nr:tetratricopeptide repeat-containing sensor histidine kinase [Plebeiobacterium sediminum]MCW3785875.1 tetratricopeptide repeat-containing sensor histidine kinase [Plebeiobacterium sediminum]